MFVHYRTLGIIIKKENRGEANQLLTIITKDFGKVKILAKAIRKIKSKLKSGVPLFSLSEINFIQGKRYKILTDAIREKKFTNINSDLNKLRIVTEIGENIDFLLREGEKEEEVWKLALKTFYKIDESTDSNFDFLIYHYFFWNLLVFLGYKPELVNCSSCQRRLAPSNLYFDSNQGGVICSSCFEKLRSGERIDPETVKVVRFLIKEDWEELEKLRIDRSHKKELKKISNVYLSYFKDILNPL